MAALRRCATPGCPDITPTTRCPDHQRDHERARGSTARRGYGHAHRRKRATIAARIDRGELILCVRCDQPITTSSALDLGHTDDRTAHSGPEHSHCNRSAGGKKAHQPGPPPPSTPTRGGATHHD